MRTVLVLACLLLTTPARAQLPVIDATAISKAVAALVELRKQVRLLTEDLAIAKQVRDVAASHYSRYARALTKRGVVATLPLGRITDELEDALAGALSYKKPDDLDALFALYEMPADPLAYDSTVTVRAMNTVSHTMQALSVHGQHLRHTHDELERFKHEIASNPEPQQMLDVQASLQVLVAREALMTRQALMTLTNMDAIRAAQALNEQAQHRALYDTFVGYTNWLGDPRQYSVKSFLRMPGE